MTQSSCFGYAIAVAELSDVVSRIEVSRPNLYVAKFQVPVHGDFLRSMKRRQRYGPFVRGLWSGFVPELVESLDAARQRRRALIKELEQQKFVVNPTPDFPRRVYVLELDAYKYPDLSGPVVYVGETSRTVEQRIQQHLEGVNSSAHVQRAFVRRRPELEPEELYPSRVHATLAETAVGKSLQTKGFLVAGPQGLEDKPKPPRR